jgi:hypothetical protein
MKPLSLTLSAAALLALAISPALSASRHHARHHHHYYYGGTTTGYDGRPFYSGGVSSPAPIYRQGRYLGTDPDPSVRFEIARDPYFARK